jgi:hypothetical protein
MKIFSLVVCVIGLTLVWVSAFAKRNQPLLVNAAQVAPGLNSFAAQVRAPAWSRGLQYLPISFDECSGRARRALEAEGFTVENGGTGFGGDQYFAGSKDGYCAVIACNASPTDRTWANIFVGSFSNGDITGMQRQRLQTQMGVPVSASGGCGLGTRWNESEEGWAATWTRRGNSNVFDVQSRKGGMLLTAINTINISGNRVSISRTNASDGNNCDMQGTIDQDGVTVSGTYSCRSGGPYSWRAKISCQ